MSDEPQNPKAYRIATDANVRPKNVNRIGLLGLLASTLLVIFGPAAEHSLLRPPWSAIVMLAGMVGWIAAGVYLFMHQRFRRGVVEVDDQRGIYFERGTGSQTIPRSDIKSAFFAPGSGRLRSAVRLLGHRDQVLGQIAVDTQAQADRILDTLGLGAQQRTAPFKGYAPLLSTSWYSGLVGLVLGGIIFILGAPLNAPWLILLGLPMMLASSYLGLTCNIHVGADGLLIGTRIAPQFIPWSEVVAVEPLDNGVVVMRRDGKKRIRIPMAQRYGRRLDEDKVIIKALVTRARQALDAYKQGAELPNVAALVARRGRSYDEWLKSLVAQFGSGEGDFRSAPILDDQLWNVVESPTAEMSARAGAAAILARRAAATAIAPDQAERSRFRIAADACTEPHLRVVLDHVASGASNEEVEKSLLALAEEQQAAEEQQQQQQQQERKA